MKTLAFVAVAALGIGMPAAIGARHTHHRVSPPAKTVSDGARGGIFIGAFGGTTNRPGHHRMFWAPQR